MAHSDYSNSSISSLQGNACKAILSLLRYPEVGPKTQNILTVLPLGYWTLNVYNKFQAD